MNVTKYNPFNWLKKEQENSVQNLPVRRTDTPAQTHPLLELHREMDRLFADFAQGFGRGFPSLFNEWPDAHWQTEFRPSLDITESEKEYKVAVELPGISEKDVNVEIVGDTLRISGEKKMRRRRKRRTIIAWSEVTERFSASWRFQMMPWPTVSRPSSGMVS